MTVSGSPQTVPFRQLARTLVDTELQRVRYFHLRVGHEWEQESASLHNVEFGVDIVTSDIGLCARWGSHTNRELLLEEGSIITKLAVPAASDVTDLWFARAGRTIVDAIPWCRTSGGPPPGPEDEPPAVPEMLELVFESGERVFLTTGEANAPGEFVETPTNVLVIFGTATVRQLPVGPESADTSPC